MRVGEHPPARYPLKFLARAPCRSRATVRYSDPSSSRGNHRHGARLFGRPLAVLRDPETVTRSDSLVHGTIPQPITQTMTKGSNTCTSLATGTHHSCWDGAVARRRQLAEDAAHVPLHRRYDGDGHGQWRN